MPYIGNIPVPQATQTRDRFTATSGQTTFATSGYTPGFLDVYLNGVHLDASDYTATNGSDVVLDTGAATDDIVEVVAFTAFEPANIDAVSAANGGTFSGAITVDEDGATVATFDRASSDGAIVELKRDGSTVGTLAKESHGDVVFYPSESGHKGIRLGNGFLAPVGTDGGNTDATTNLGFSNNRFNNLYLSGGAYLGGTGSANHLTDYEEGDYQPTLSSTGGGTVSALSTLDTLSYTKVGRFVHIQGNLHNLTISGVSGDLDVTLPFVAGGGTERSDWAAGFVLITEALTTSDNFSSGQLILPYLLTGGDSYIRISGGADQLNTGVNTDVRLSFQYITSA